MKKIFYTLFIAVFFAFCLVPTAGLIINGPCPVAANEVPAAVPRVKSYDGSLNTGFLTSLRDYVGKGFFLRLECITGWDTLCARLFHTSANSEILLGPDGWLFHGAAADELAGAGQMTDREIWACARGVYLMQEYAWNQGARFVFTVPCGKYTLYPDHAPDYVTVAEGSNRQRLQTALRMQGVNYADLYDAFTAVDEELYWQWDSHWNAKGAALAADTILAAAGREGGYFSGGFTATEAHTGDLYSMLFPAGTAQEPDYAPAAPFTFTHTSAFHDYDDITITTECPDGEGGLLLFRDSSGRNLYPYLAQSFETAYISRQNNYRLDLAAEQKPDVVVAELAERTLNYLLKYPAVYPAPVRDGAVLSGAVAAESELSVDDTESAMEGFIKLTGTLPETAVDSCVYVAAGDTVYEAIPNEGSFTAWLPAGITAADVTVYISR